MEFEKIPSLPDAHQQIRLGDIQVSGHKWTAAIEYYLRAIECFQTIQNTLRDDSLISSIQAQIVQCEKTIHLCRLKDRSEQAIKAECHSKLSRAHSVSNMEPSTKPTRVMQRHNTLQLENNGRDGMDSFAALIFPNNNRNIHRSSKTPPPIVAKKNQKNDSQKMEELKTGYEATKTHLKVAFDEIERLKHENNMLRMQKGTNPLQEPIHYKVLSSNSEAMDKETHQEETESELEATL